MGNIKAFHAPRWLGKTQIAAELLHGSHSLRVRLFEARRPREAAPAVCARLESLLKGQEGHAIRDERKLRMAYIDAASEPTTRIVWPFAMAFFDSTTRTFAAWCELRNDFRHFRADRITALVDTGESYPERRHALLKRWWAAHPRRGRSTDTTDRN